MTRSDAARIVRECSEPERAERIVRECANEGCVRSAEAGERWCATCGLERALYRRDRRPPAPAAGPAPDRR